MATCAEQLSKREAACVADFIEFNLIDNIRDDPNVDSIEWVCDMAGAYKKLRSMAEASE